MVAEKVESAIRTDLHVAEILACPGEFLIGQPGGQRDKVRPLILRSAPWLAIAQSTAAGESVWLVPCGTELDQGGGFLFLCHQQMAARQEHGAFPSRAIRVRPRCGDAIVPLHREPDEGQFLGRIQLEPSRSRRPFLKKKNPPLTIRTNGFDLRIRLTRTKATEIKLLPSSGLDTPLREWQARGLRCMIARSDKPAFPTLPAQDADAGHFLQRHIEDACRAQLGGGFSHVRWWSATNTQAKRVGGSAGR